MPLVTTPFSGHGCSICPFTIKTGQRRTKKCPRWSPGSLIECILAWDGTSSSQGIISIGPQIVVLAEALNPYLQYVAISIKMNCCLFFGMKGIQYNKQLSRWFICSRDIIVLVTQHWFYCLQVGHLTVEVAESTLVIRNTTEPVSNLYGLSLYKPIIVSALVWSGQM